MNFSKAETKSSTTSTPKMHCYQCEQTQDSKGCTVVGNCGKTPDVAGIQDLLIFMLRRLCLYVHYLRENKVEIKGKGELDNFILSSVYATLTNVNFDYERFVELVKEASNKIKFYESEYNKHKLPKIDFYLEDSLSFDNKTNFEGLGVKYSNETIVGIVKRNEKFSEEMVSLQELTMYGLKGLGAYTKEGDRIDEAVMDYFYKSMGFISDSKNTEFSKKNLKLEDNISMALECGKHNITTLKILRDSHVNKFKVPEPTQVRMTPKAGKCILVSGHHIEDLEAILKQTEGKGINVYTHGELLPANAYPEIKKYKHLIGNYGGPWQLQKIEFSNFPGAILVTTNCIVEPRKKYEHRIFTTNAVGYKNIKHITNKDFSEVIKAALAEPGFKEDVKPEKFALQGCGHEAVLGLAGPVINAIKKGDIKKFNLIGGCDGAEADRTYYRDLALSLPKDNVILTLGCAQYRFINEDFGTIKTNFDNKDMELPRILPIGQCNDSYGAVQIALALAEAFQTDVNSLPINYEISWFEQKAVVVLLTLLHLGVRNINLGPRLPAFVPKSLLDILIKNFNLGASDTTKVFKN